MLPCNIFGFENGAIEFLAQHLVDADSLAIEKTGNEKIGPLSIAGSAVHAPTGTVGTPPSSTQSHPY
jgi:hypothetical protein